MFRPMAAPKTSAREVEIEARRTGQNQGSGHPGKMFCRGLRKAGPVTIPNGGVVLQDNQKGSKGSPSREENTRIGTPCHVRRPSFPGSMKSDRDQKTRGRYI